MNSESLRARFRSSRGATIASAIAALSFISATATTLAAPVSFEIDTAHSSLGFRIRHLVSTVNGQFNSFSGKIVYDEADPRTSSVDVTIDAASIDTNQTKRDDHLRSPDFFDVAQFPEIRFQSKAVRIAGQALTIDGDLTMHGVTMPVTLSGEVSGVLNEANGNKRAGFSATTRINRKDFGIVWNKTLDQGGTLLGDDVEVRIDIQAVHRTAEAK